ncbi:late competence protein ComER [Neobacillus sedimentimangrovi]|jgi:competence protein ComER|uniref:Pyrroline-5-carboxylate reductase n=1 Tax=Neobacillus sedimentimangrovi TaxID=2699460 RepID=A0ABS8QH39_9BACI|nr:late competence protein ComER [Neobacillus sedimentimangrovi]MCD4838558.1 late competence protein ComER [Neobacillus sedimentimangrovi]
MNVGIIGTGNMGRILIEAFIEGKAISPSSIMITNRTIAKALLLKDIYKDIKIGANDIEVAAVSDVIFICVKPLDVFKVIDRINPFLTKEKCLISITSPISTSQIERKVPCSVMRIIPSITNRALAGVSLFTLGENCSDYWKVEMEKIMSKVSVPIYIDDKLTRVASDIVSCGPAFFSYLIQSFIKAAVNETKIDEKTATNLASHMLVGMGELLKQGHYTLPSLQEKVSVKGGITGEGIKVMEKELGNMFEHVFQATHDKFQEDLEKVELQFSQP